MNVVLTGEVSDIMFEKLLNAFEKLKEGNTLKIYLNSEGGSVYEQDAIVDFININKERVRLIGYGQLFSAAFNIFFKVECPRELIVDTIGMAHFCWTTVEIDQSGKPADDFNKFQAKEMKRTQDETVQFLKKVGLSTTEVNKIIKGKDIWISYPRMLQLFNNGKKEG